MRFRIEILIALFFISIKIYSQGCCSGGSGSPIAGGASQGVLQDRQMEIGLNYQYYNTDKFKSGDKDTISTIKSFNSNYLYLRVAYGLTKNLTMSVESGYFLNKTQDDTIKSSGIADLILFPRYDVLNRTTETRRTELTLGLGLKIPLGKYDDSTYTYTDYRGKKHYTTSPPTVQPTNGSNDFIFYGFFFRGYPLKNFRLFANALYIHKGYNPLGQKFGDYASVGLFAGKTFFQKLGVTLQLKGEWIDKMKYDKNVDMTAIYNIDPLSTGGRKVLFVPQVSFTQKNFTIYALTEIPLYQYVNRTQVVSKYQATVGISYRFFTYKNKVLNSNGDALYICPMKCTGSESSVPGKCKECGMDLIKK